MTWYDPTKPQPYSPGERAAALQEATKTLGADHPFALVLARYEATVVAVEQCAHSAADALRKAVGEAVVVLTDATRDYARSCRPRKGEIQS